MFSLSLLSQSRLPLVVLPMTGLAVVLASSLGLVTNEARNRLWTGAFLLSAWVSVDSWYSN